MVISSFESSGSAEQIREISTEGGPLPQKLGESQAPSPEEPLLGSLGGQALPYLSNQKVYQDLGRETELQLL